MKLFTTKKEREEKQRKEQEALENAKFENEVNAKMTAGTEKKKIIKLIAELEQKEKTLIKSAADAKSKGYGDVYRTHVSFIKTVRAQKMKADKFLYQVEAMQTMKSISDSSSALLDSMGKIANTLGTLTIDKNAMLDMQKKFVKSQEQLERTNILLEEVTEGMEATLDSVDISDLDGNIDQTIESDIESFIQTNNNVDVSQYEQLLGK